MSCLPSAIFLTPSSNSLLHQPGSSHSQPGISQAQPSFMHLHPSCAHNMLHLTLYRALHILICFVYSELCSAHPQAGSLYRSITTHPLLFCSHTMSIAHPRLKLAENWAVIALFDAGSWRGRESRHAQHMF